MSLLRRDPNERRRRRLTTAVLRGDLPGVLTAVDGADEADRRWLWAGLRADDEASRPTREPLARFARGLAGVCLADPVAAWDGLHVGFGHPGALVGLLVGAIGSRPRAWREAFVARMLRDEFRAAPVWALIHGLVAAGHVDRPESTNYLVGLWGAISLTDLPVAVAAQPSVREDLWAALRVDGTGLRLASGPFVVAPADWWDGLVSALDAHEPANRRRLLAECLVRIGTTSTTEGKGYLGLHEHLAVTDLEIAERQERYLALLTAPGRGAVGLGQWAARRLLGVGLLDSEAFCDAGAEVLVRPEKGLVRAQLALLSDTVAGGAVDPARVAPVLAGALDPARADLAVAIAVLLRRCAAQLDEPSLADLRRLVASSVDSPWPDLRAALGAALAPPLPTEAATAPTGTTRPPPLPVDLPAPGVVVPPADVDELADLVAHLVEDPGDPLEVEIALAGMSRRPHERPIAAEALRRRATRQALRWSHGDLPSYGTALLGVVLTWLGGEAPAVVPGLTRTGVVHDERDLPAGVEAQELMAYTAELGHHVFGWSWTVHEQAWTPSMLQHARFAEMRGLVTAGARVDRVGTELLATPTRTDGSIDAGTLLERWARLGADVARRPHDRGGALLRLRPGDRAGVLASGMLSRGDASSLARLDAGRAWRRSTEALGGGRWNTISGRTDGSVWLAEQDADGGVDAPVEAWLDTRSVVTHWNDQVEWSDDDATFGAGLAAWAMAVPHDPDLLAVQLQPALAFWVEKPRAYLGGVVRALAGSGAVLGHPAASALVWAASFKDVTIRTTAAETIADAAQRGALDGRTLGSELVALLGPNAGPAPWGRPPMTNRVAATLADASSLGEHAARVVLDALVVTLPILDTLRGGADLADLAAQLAERSGARVDLPPDLARRAAGSSSTRIAAAARRLAAAGR